MIFRMGHVFLNHCIIQAKCNAILQNSNPLTPVHPLIISVFLFVSVSFFFKEDQTYDQFDKLLCPSQFVCANTSISFFPFPFLIWRTPCAFSYLFGPAGVFFCLYGNVTKRKGKSKDEGAAWYFSLQRMCYQLDSKFKKQITELHF